ncbi:MAG: S-adenosylmethionine:tRNA ribosyltransferase-isomerase [Bacteroidota bacterium]
MHPKDLQIKDFTYELPDELIARYPLAERDQSKLLIYQDEQIAQDIYANIADHLPEKTFLVFNNTKVVEARLLFEKPNGGKIEIFCLEPDEQYSDISSAMLQKEKVLWKCLVGGAKKWKEGSLILRIQKYDFTEILLSARKVEQLADSYIIELSWSDPSLSFAELLHIAGAIPLPPYLNRNAEESDKERYQTIYAKHDGSVAAPTAGLHFTDAVFSKLQQKNILHDFVTLHVGAGTFKPVKSNTMQEHEMHAEFIDVSVKFLEKLIQQSGNTVVAVGTTSSRTLESLYWLGVKIKRDPSISIEALPVTQWEPYDLSTHNINSRDALQALLAWLQERKIERLITKTQIIIAPGYQFKIISGLITNFHQPQSTLLLLVAAITGNNWKQIYRYAIDHAFRFLSYGDGGLLWVK